MIETLIEMQEGKRKRPWPCRFGFHEMHQVQRLITTGHAVCARCGAVWMTSLFGDFDLSRSESVAFLRKHADKLEPASEA
jgi:hypothetical protein